MTTREQRAPREASRNGSCCRNGTSWTAESSRRQRDSIAMLAACATSVFGVSFHESQRTMDAQLTTEGIYCCP
eukprot:scaffold8596_cov63-Phaeocystis_antarctica.AAC.5